MILSRAHGVRAALSFDAGIEIVSPLPGASTDMAASLTRFIQAHGEGLFAVIYSVDNVEEARAKAEQMGVQVVGELKLNSEELKQHGLDGWVKTFVEYMLNPGDTFGAFIVLGQFSPG